MGGAVQESREMKDLLLRFYEALSAGDFSTIEKSVARGPETLAIGSDPAEFWRGDRVLGALREQIEAAGGFPLTPGDPVAYEHGDVGWVADRATLKFQGQPDMTFRVTATAIKDEGDWKIVQMHASFGVANEEALGQELPT
jgi:hypothetical protein